MRPWSFSRLLLLALVTLVARPTFGATVNVGYGSYSTTLPSGAVGPQNSSNQNVSPKIAATFAQPVQTNDFWSSLIYPFYGSAHSNVLYAHPLMVKAIGTGLQIGHTSTPTYAASDYLYPWSLQLTVGVAGLSSSQTKTLGYGDWTATAQWSDASRTMEATFGHGLPFVFFKVTGANAVVTPEGAFTTWYNQSGTLGLTIQGRHYGIFAPTGSTWTGTGPLQSSLNGQTYLSIALLPDNQPATLQLFRKHAYAFVTDSRVQWQYDEAAATVNTTYSYVTVLKESNGTSVNQTMTALYRHQWLHTSDPLTSYSYQSPNGQMKLYEGSAFTTSLPFSGVLPALPDRGDYNRAELLAQVQAVAAEVLPVGPTYENGKAIARFAHLVHIADQLGATTERDHFLAEIKTRLENWFTAGGSQQYVYNDTWDVLTGYPSGYGADNQINDHHFHSAYAILGAATVAQYDSVWASQAHWGGMVNLLIGDGNNWERTDTRFPFLRSHDAYAGHSWAAGHGDFGDGNNQESSSESMNFATAAILWGQATGQTDIRDLGVYLHATEKSAVEQYWFDVDNAVFPASYAHVAIGMVWGGKGVHSTWFGANPEFIHGINILPVNGGSLYLGHHPDHVLANYAEIVAERGGQPIIWQDLLWEYLALADPNLALSHYFANSNYTPFDGESRAHTLHWLFNLKKMGRVETTIRADVPTYAVFRDPGGYLTYVAYNAGAADRLVTFTDGYSFTVGPRQTRSHSTSPVNPEAPVVLLLTNKTSGKAPLTIQFTGHQSFDPNGRPLTFAWSFEGVGTSHAADTTVAFTAVGDHWVHLTVTNSIALASRESVLVTVLPNGTPYFGTPAAMPGRIQAENYDLGGEGRAYHDVNSNNIGLAYRPSEGVDLEGAAGGGYDVYWIVAGEWLEYTFSVAQTGYYDIVPYVATVPGFGNFVLSVDNVDVSGKRAVTSTGGWQFWTAKRVERVLLTAGTHVLRFDFDSDSDKTGWLFSLNYIDVEFVSPAGVEDGITPRAFGLSRAYPNPFHPRTTIEYVLPAEGPVRLAVYDASGRQVRVLADSRMRAGKHMAAWDGRDDGGKLLASGVYFVRFEAAGMKQVGKLVLFK
ncbi:MAG: carbohydrate-binding protein [Candidatus Eisenbacteria bacterium]|uniref:glucan endo-1,3-beta-D-glucosidase n=1 Tax=Eiseniibacteriota bacterium TaxID=2212470 RepID=A0A933SB94_UNCEI|nr:carbohydrate-binding protein [Candidatus Eisenbacteria bacterium]